MAKKTQNTPGMFGGKSFKDLLISSTHRGDLFFAFAIILMLVILIMPMPFLLKSPTNSVHFPWCC